MKIEIDFESEDALYIQIRDQIIYGIATRQYQEGDSLPSVRELAESVGINMHTVNKAYDVLRQEGLLRLGRRTGAVIAIDLDKLGAMEDMRDELRVILARGFCKGISREEVFELVNEIYSEYE
ncbi:MAG: GntR family transcriptional regulator [Lachnospiraceae bacterium]|nr:GntR family transcriptional regulator [Lachnospiraceae bacterium]